MIVTSNIPRAGDAIRPALRKREGSGFVDYFRNVNSFTHVLGFLETRGQRSLTADSRATMSFDLYVELDHEARKLGCFLSKNIIIIV